MLRDYLDSEDFYNQMQAYRHASVIRAAYAFEAVKRGISAAAIDATLAEQAKQEPVAWMGVGPRDGRIEFSNSTPAPSVMRDFNMRPLYLHPAPAPEGMVKLQRSAEIYAAERDHARARYERTVRILIGIHALLYPPRFTDSDGRTRQFKSPFAEEQMQELSERIRAIPDEIAAAEKEVGQ